MEADAATKYIVAAMWTPVILLLLGGFTVAAALSKYDIAKRIATIVLSKAGTRPRTVLLTNMFVAAFASMWISNVAAPVLCLSIISVRTRTTFHYEVLLTILAHAAEPSIRLANVKSAHPRNSTCFQHWWDAVAHCFPTKYCGTPDHGASTILGNMVLHRHSCRHHLYPTNLDPPTSDLQAWKRNNNCSYPACKR